jgi:outer membrane protein assembly factor BamB
MSDYVSHDAAFTLQDPDDGRTTGSGITLALSGNGMAFVVDSGSLSGFDLVGRKLAWKSGGTIVGAPAVARNVVYAINAYGTVLDKHGSVLEARDAATGVLQWSSGLLPGGYSLVVTDNLAFIGTDHKTVAIDLATHRQVWEYAASGELSISNRGVLYIGGEGGKITAINLR